MAAPRRRRRRGMPGIAESRHRHAERIPHLLHELERVLRRERKPVGAGRLVGRRLAHRGLLVTTSARAPSHAASRAAARAIRLLSSFMTDIRATLRARLAAAVGSAQVLTAPADVAPYLTDWRGRYHGRARGRRAPGEHRRGRRRRARLRRRRRADRPAGRQHRPVRRRDAGRRAATRSCCRLRA